MTPAEKMTTELSDVEICRLCALALGWKHLGAIGKVYRDADGDFTYGPDNERWCRSGANDWWQTPAGDILCGSCEGIPNPLTNKAQAWDLMVALRIDIEHLDKKVMASTEAISGTALDADPLRAICLCAARIQQAKERA